MDSTTGTVFVIDDDADVRDGLSRLLRSAGWDVEGFASARPFLDRAQSAVIGCILLDISMPDMSGPEMHVHLSSLGITLPVIYLTGNATVPTSVQAMKRGAVDFLEKPIDADALLPAIGRAVDGHRSACAQESRRHAIEERVAQLSVREREVLHHVVRGRLNKQIAADLGIALKTVKVHRGRVMAKMRVRSLAELVQLCDAASLIESVEA